MRLEILYATADSNGMVRKENMGEVKAFDTNTDELICCKPTKRTKNNAVKIVNL